ncbi:TPA: hypothetical protein DDZ86_03355 [Candidatus Dependentiae bacterium]|nr:MAG: hypothetical protein UW09_C0003G0024 [candidate division TM6 bacterium GW2011_GWF2_43_87]HBL98654.1 hypothetical protein [Candidatus Dependentiae bacterium]
MKNLLFLTLSILLPTASLNSTIYETTEIEALVPLIKEELQKEPGPCAIVAVDLDNTTLKAGNPKATDEWFSEKIKEYTAQGLTSDQAVARIMPEHLQAHRTTKVTPVDVDVKPLIDALQHKNVHVIALTARNLDFVNISLRQLHDIKIDLTPKGHTNGAIERWELCYKLGGLPKDAYYIPGIIFASGNDKGMVFEHFLRQLKYRPHLVIFVDDSANNIKAVDQMCKRLGIKKCACFMLTKVKQGISPESGKRFNQKEL